MLDLTKKFITRDGRPARLIAKDLHGERPLVFAVTVVGGDHETVCITRLDGTYAYSPSGADIINVVGRTEKFGNIYSSVVCINPTREKANENASARRDGVLRLSYEDGVLVSAELVK